MGSLLATKNMLLSGAIACALILATTAAAVAQQTEAGAALTPPVSPIRPTPSDPWDLAPWTAVGLVAVALCALLAWWIVGRDASPAPAGDDPDGA